MNDMFSRCLAAGFGLLVIVAAGAQEPTGQPRERSVDSMANSVMRQMNDHLAKLVGFRFEAEVVLDEVLDSGQKLQFSNRLKVDVQRPNRVRVQVEGDVANRRIWYDGRQVTVLEARDKMYVTVETPDTIDAMLNQVIEKFGLPMPLADLLFSDVSAALTCEVQTDRHVGMHHIGEYNCHHLAFTQETVDWQLWVQAGPNPLPRKLTITYKQLPSVPQYTATLVKWDTAVTFDAGHFVFTPPRRAKKIEILPPEQPFGTVRTGSVYFDGRRHFAGPALVPGPGGGTTAAAEVPKYGGEVLQLPEGHKKVMVRGATYYVHNDVYHVAYRKRTTVWYIIVSPPTGVTVTSLPAGSRTVRVGDTSYYYCNDVYYVATVEDGRTKYLVVDTPEGAAISALPTEHDTVLVQGLSYYRVGNVYYRPYYREGQVLYVRVKSPH